MFLYVKTVKPELIDGTKWTCLLLHAEGMQPVEQDIVLGGDHGQPPGDGHGQAVGEAAWVPVILGPVLHRGRRGGQSLSEDALGRAGLPHS